MLMQFSHYTDGELLRFIRSQPDHLMAEGELVRRVTADEWGQGERDEECEQLEEEKEKMEEQIEELKKKLEAIREAVAE